MRFLPNQITNDVTTYNVFKADFSEIPPAKTYPRHTYFLLTRHLKSDFTADFILPKMNVQVAIEKFNWPGRIVNQYGLGCIIILYNTFNIELILYMAWLRLVGSLKL